MDMVLDRMERGNFRLLLAVSALAAVLLVYTFVLHPRLRAYLGIAETEATLSRTVAGSAMLSDQMSRLHADIDRLQRQLHGDMASLPSKEIEAFVVGKLQQLSWRNDVQLVGVEPSAGTTIESFHELLFRVTLAGNYFDMYRWLHDVSSELGFVLIKEYEMRPIDVVATDPQLSVRLVMATYRTAR